MSKDERGSLTSSEESELILLLEWLASKQETEKLQNSFADFVRAAWSQIEGTRPLRWNWHLDVICSHLDALAQGRERRVIFNVPPRTSKSTLVSVMFPCWLWAREPSITFMFASYSWGLSQDHAYKRRAILESNWYRDRFGETVTISGDRNNIMNIANTAHGIMYSTSSGGAITGRGADYLLLDDPNDTKEPESEVQRRTLHNWYDTTWSTRANDIATARHVIIQQRTHTEDITGHAMQSRNWKLVKIPMEFNPSSRADGDLRATAGELLDPVRFPLDEIEMLKRQIGPYAWAGQYQQEPYPLGGGIIKESWLGKWTKSTIQPGHIAFEDGRYNVDPWRSFRFATVDLAMTEKTIGQKKLGDPDYTVMGAWMCHQTPRGPYVLLLDLIRERQEGPETLSKLQGFHRHWKFSFIAIEDISEKMWYQQARRAGLPVREISTSKSDDVIYTVDKDKVARAVAATPLIADRRFFVPEYAPWLSDFIAELVAFPNGAHDDQLDVAVYACAIAEKIPAHAFFGRDEPGNPQPSPDDGVNRNRDENRDPMAGYFVNKPQGL